MSVFGSWAIERFGRRSLLLVGSIATSVCSYGVAIVSVTISENTLVGSRLIVTFIFLYIVRAYLIITRTKTDVKRLFGPLVGYVVLENQLFC